MVEGRCNLVTLDVTPTGPTRHRLLVGYQLVRHRVGRVRRIEPVLVHILRGIVEHLLIELDRTLEFVEFCSEGLLVVAEAVHSRHDLFDVAHRDVKAANNVLYHDS